MMLGAQLKTDIPACMKTSKTETEMVQCIQQDGFSAGCAQCVGTYAKCIATDCGSQCKADPTGAACKTCYTDKCEPAFYSCTGFPQPRETPKMSSQERLVQRMMRTE